MRILSVFGTRPEAIKLAPVILELNREISIDSRICVTGQHRQMLDQVLQTFQLVPDHDLDIMRPDQDLTHVTSAALHGLGEVLDDINPDWVLVQGDTSTAFAATLAAYYRKIKVAHVEAGLRTGNIYSPWPEEGNRKLISQLASLHFAPTTWSAGNLEREGISNEFILVTGNTVIDALRWVSRRLETDQALERKARSSLPPIDEGRRLILVTGHRRENFDGGLERVCTALSRLAKRNDIEIIYPVHLNPRVRAIAQNVLGNQNSVHLIEPLDYLPFVLLMRQAYFIVTDSGGIQEEAPGLAKPVLITRETTERPEAVDAGTALLVGTNTDELVSVANSLLDKEDIYQRMACARNPFGDGRASKRIVERLLKNTVS